MIRTSSNKLMVLSAVLQRTHDFIVIGEVHGSKQNALLTQELLFIILAEPKPITVAFEWGITDSERDAFRTYICGGDVPAQLPTFFLDSDGRFTHEHFSLLNWIRIYNSTHNNIIDIHTFADSSNSEEPEQAMADSLHAYKKHHTGSTILVETGNMHARNSSYVSMGTKHVPMAAILKKNHTVFSIFLQYLQGKVLVEGRNLDVTEVTSQQQGPGHYFDAMIEIPISEAAQNHDSLTKIAQLLQS